MNKLCPVCDCKLQDPLPNFCEQCAWDIKNDITLTVSINPISETAIEEYKKRVQIAHHNWQVIQASKEAARQSKEDVKRLQRDLSEERRSKLADSVNNLTNESSPIISTAQRQNAEERRLSKSDKYSVFLTFCIIISLIIGATIGWGAGEGFISTLFWSVIVAIIHVLFFSRLISYCIDCIAHNDNTALPTIGLFGVIGGIIGYWSIDGIFGDGGLKMYWFIICFGLLIGISVHRVWRHNE